MIDQKSTPNAENSHIGLQEILKLPLKEKLILVALLLAGFVSGAAITGAIGVLGYLYLSQQK